MALTMGERTEVLPGHRAIAFVDALGALEAMGRGTDLIAEHPATDTGVVLIGDAGPLRNVGGSPSGSLVPASECQGSPASGILARLVPLPWNFAAPHCPGEFASQMAVREWIEVNAFSSVLGFEGSDSYLRLYVVAGRVCGMEALSGGAVPAGPLAARGSLALLAGHPVASFASGTNQARGLALLASAVLIPWSDSQIVAPCSVLDFELLATLTSTASVAAVAVRHGAEAAVGWRVGPAEFVSAREGEEARSGTAAIEEMWTPGGMARICWSSTLDLPPLLSPSRA